LAILTSINCFVPSRSDYCSGFAFDADTQQVYLHGGLSGRELVKHDVARRLKPDNTNANLTLDEFFALKRYNRSKELYFAAPIFN
jgi:hypothetical protein